MKTNLQELLVDYPSISPEEVPRLLSFSETEMALVESMTLKQWKCEEWYLHRVGFITASKCKRVFTRQEALQRIDSKNVAKTPHIHPDQQQEMEPQNPREGGLFHEESARRAYQLVVSSFRLRLSRDTWARNESLTETANSIIKAYIDELTFSLLATADIGSGSSFVGPFPPTKYRLQM